ncbi:alcohol dehydrogenase [Friedmanniella endophytica]|uniref:Alcohol dehydrogenase n=1 Tax=Microlunatus kandeliicorticis TaxID=1759536 RepID=A0A7W3IP62_9ACTN|nr:alcohol dehydrogenase catalytic domain-containing protein [Microlunatus kandeliicorticis]MBA8792620.1 alcohol dehydrogenase [Microlunatus kandeliicorticis]
MRAVVYSAVGAPPRLTETADPVCPADGVVVAVRATGVCRSDWHAWRGHEAVPLPHVPGHEFAGTVAEVGSAVEGFAVGDRVTAPFVNGCGRCRWCRTGQAQVCPDQTQPGFTGPGSFAERVVVRAAGTNLVRLPDQVDFVAAAALGCRFATAFRAVTGHHRPAPGDPVAVVGCGGVGLSAVMIATALGARVVAVDPSEAARTRARELGAVAALAAGEPAATAAEVAAALRSPDREDDVDGAVLAIDCFGSAATAEASVRSLARRGHHVQAGLMLGPEAAAPLPWDLLVARELSVHGSHGMAAADYPEMLALIAEGRLRPDRLVGAVIGLDGAAEALTAMDAPVTGRAGATVIRLD